jgi:electron transport complex protein RnfD
MWTVVLALAPAAVFGMYVFGWGAFPIGTPAAWWPFIVCIGSMLVAMATEAVILRLTGRDPKIALDGSAAVTGLLFAMICGPQIHWYVWVIGSVSAISLFKHTFGGLGCNVWNPALMARAFTLLAWGQDLTQGFIYPDGTTGATPLAIVKQVKNAAAIAADKLDLGSLFWGKTAGCIGETSAALLLIGGLFLIALKYVDWRMPLSYVLTTVLLMWIIPYRNAEANKLVEEIWPWYRMPFFAAFSGGLFLGAFFMATDMVTTPITKKGQVIFGIGCGALTAIIRLWGGYPEGVCYSILLMNTATPIIDRFTRPRKFGAEEYAGTASAA